MNIHLVMAVWGNEFLNTFFQAALPSQLAPGNLPGLSKVAKIIYHVFTPDEDRLAMESHQLFPQLQRYSEIRFHPLPQGEAIGAIPLMTKCHAEILKITEWKEPLFFLCPDIICSQNCFLTLWSLLQKNKRVVLIAGPRVVKEDYLTALNNDSKEVRYQSRNLVRQLMLHLHPVSQSLFWDQREINRHPSFIYWPLEKKGLLARCFHLHPLLIWPEEKSVLSSSIDDYFVQKTVPDLSSHYLVTDSDELVVIELSKASHMTPILTMSANPENIAVWLERITDTFQRSLAQHPIFFRSDDSDFKEIVERSEHILSKILRRASFPPPSKWSAAIYRFVKRKWKRYRAK